VSEFYKDRSTKSGYKSHCKNCRRLNNNPDLRRNWESKYRQKQKNLVYNYYSNGKFNCAKCGYTNYLALTVDHINGDGNKHRREVGDIYKFLIRNNFPTGYQILCMNCQFVKKFEKVDYISRRSKFDLDRKRKVLSHYSDKCPASCENCDNIDERVLTIDHIDSDGILYRKVHHSIYVWLALNDYPDNLNLQVLCMNCQFIKRVECDGLTCIPLINTNK